MRGEGEGRVMRVGGERQVNDGKRGRGGVESDRIILTHHINKCNIEKYTS